MRLAAQNYKKSNEIVAILIGLATAGVAVLGLVRGSVYCRGGPYMRATQPLAFWAAIGVYLMWSVLMGYAVFFFND